MKFRLFTLSVGLLFILSNCTQKANSAQKTDTVIEEGPRLEITVDYEKQSGRGSNQYAVWIENSEGALVRTLFVTKFTAKGGYDYRPDCMPLWVSKANPQTHTALQIDAYTGATPKSGPQVYMWDLKDDEGKTVTPEEYTFVVQGTLLGPSQVIYKNNFRIGNEELSINTAPEYSTGDMANRGMIRSVNARYIP